MMHAKNVTGTPVKPAIDLSLLDKYVEAITLVERLEKRLLEMIKDEFERRGRHDVNPVQALLIYKIGDSQLRASELMSRGCYMGTNVSYNLKKLVEQGLVNHKQSRNDRRAVMVSLTPEGLEVAKAVGQLYERQMASLEKVSGITADDFGTIITAMKRLDRFWSDQIRYQM
ncbi:MAG: archaellum operon transcriptional activator EarA family protein [Nitratireductor sp.]|jgi:DNA-binding MarR family transcriptional regulator|nr:archaellum operon transcriptional activator EarA family protein [Nitratireductor sp.]